MTTWRTTLPCACLLSGLCLRRSCKGLSGLRKRIPSAREASLLFKAVHGGGSCGSECPLYQVPISSSAPISDVQPFGGLNEILYASQQCQAHSIFAHLSVHLFIHSFGQSCIHSFIHQTLAEHGLCQALHRALCSGLPSLPWSGSRESPRLCFTAGGSCCTQRVAASESCLSPGNHNFSSVKTARTALPPTKCSLFLRRVLRK